MLQRALLHLAPQRVVRPQSLRQAAALPVAAEPVAAPQVPGRPPLAVPGQAAGALQQLAALLHLAAQDLLADLLGLVAEPEHLRLGQGGAAHLSGEAGAHWAQPAQQPGHQEPGQALPSPYLETAGAPDSPLLLGCAPAAAQASSALAPCLRMRTSVMMSLRQKEDQKNELCMRLPSHPLSA